MFYKEVKKVATKIFIICTLTLLIIEVINHLKWKMMSKTLTRYIFFSGYPLPDEHELEKCAKSAISNIFKQK